MRYLPRWDGPPILPAMCGVFWWENSGSRISPDVHAEGVRTAALFDRPYVTPPTVAPGCCVGGNPEGDSDLGSVEVLPGVQSQHLLVAVLQGRECLVH